MKPICLLDNLSRREARALQAWWGADRTTLREPTAGRVRRGRYSVWLDQPAVPRGAATVVEVPEHAIVARRPN
jgi:hypothetical protein